MEKGCEEKTATTRQRKDQTGRSVTWLDGLKADES